MKHMVRRSIFAEVFVIGIPLIHFLLASMAVMPGAHFIIDIGCLAVQTLIIGIYILPMRKDPGTMGFHPSTLSNLGINLYMIGVIILICMMFIGHSPVTYRVVPWYAEILGIGYSIFLIISGIVPRP